jgi:hypothetical protein
LSFQALIRPVSRLTYVIPAFAGFFPCLHIARFNAVFRKSVKWGIIDRMFDAETLISDVEVRLFRRFKDNAEHCLNQFLPEMRIDSYLFRQRGHKFPLPTVFKALFRKSYIVNCLYTSLGDFLYLFLSFVLCCLML